jgi:alpha-mannosidase II
MCTGLCRKLRRRYCLVLVLAAALALIVARRESPAVESGIESVEHTLAAEIATGLGQPTAPTAATPTAAAVAAAAPVVQVANTLSPPPTTPPPPSTATANAASPTTPPPPPPLPPAGAPTVASALPPPQPGGTPVPDGPAGADLHGAQQEWKRLGETRTDAIDVDPILAQLSYANPWNPAPSGSKGIGSWTQGWDVKYDDADFKRGDALKVFVMPHSHNDPGWLWSFEGYYQKYTGGIITTVVKALKANPGRRFIWAEISFFELWWQHQNEQMRQNARDVVASGQLEFVTAGWVMNDEANCDVYGILEQLYEGREWVEDTFGVQPSTGYAVDPFGQSAVMAQVLKRMGYEAMYINRVQYAIKRVLAEQHNMDFIWRQHWDNAGSTDMMVHMHPFFNYDVPHSCGPQPGVCCQFDFLRLETPGMTCPWGVKPEPITARNVAERSRTYLDQIKKKATVFGGRSGRAHSVLVPIGGDLEYQHDSIASKMYENYETMFAHINKDPSYNVKIQFGTLKDYFESVAADYAKETNLRVLSGPSFFTYADKDEEYWSGYYTSRPFYKSINRELEGLLHAAQLLHSSLLHPSAANAGAAEAESGIRTAKRAMALFQHHDAITVRNRTISCNSRILGGFWV